MAYTFSEYLIRIPVTWIVVGRKGPIRTRDLITTAFPHGIATLGTAVALLPASTFVIAPGLIGCAALAFSSYSIYLLILIAFPLKRKALGVHLGTIMRLL